MRGSELMVVVMGKDLACLGGAANDIIATRSAADTLTTTAKTTCQLATLDYAAASTVFIYHA